jgi:hypothetical protein
LDVLKLTVRGPHDSITITVQKRAYPNSTDFWDGNWLVSPIEFEIGEFAGVVSQAMLRTDEIERFQTSLRDLYERNEGEALLPSLENWIELRMRGDGIGHVEVQGEIRDAASGYGNELSFSLIGIDQTYLPEVLGQLDAILEAYPVIGR